MKKAVVLMFVCLLAISAMAAEKTMIFNSATNFNGHAIAPGEYKVKYEIKGTTAEVAILQAGKIVATGTGEVVEQKDVPHYDAVVNNINSDGSKSVSEFRFNKQKQAIHFNAPAGATAGK